MKKFTSFIFALTYLTVVYAQAPQGFNYQAVIRNIDGQPLAEQNVTLQVSIQNAEGTTIFYSEQHQVTTSTAGAVSLVVGSGENISGIFNQIPWANGGIYLKVEVDPNGENNFILLGIAQIMAVPYALFAESTSLSNSIQGSVGQTLYFNGTDWIASSAIHNSGTKIGIGTTLPYAKLTVVDAGDNPTIPSGTQSAGMLRLRTSAYSNEGVDFGKMYASPYAGWIQVGYGGNTPEPLSLQPVGGKVGIGITNPAHHLEVNGNIQARGSLIGESLKVGESNPDPDNPLFVVNNSEGKTVFAVYEEGVRMYVDDSVTPQGEKSNKSGFAIGGFTGQKENNDPIEFLRVTADSVRINLRELEQGKGNKSGFAIGGYTGQKTAPTNFMFLTPENYFIGHEAGIKTAPGEDTIGKVNTFLGYQTGRENVSGHSNVFIGYKSGFYNTTGYRNIFIGNNAGFSNSLGGTGRSNVFIGDSAGFINRSGYDNVFIGTQVGRKNNNGHSNVFMGFQAGYENAGGYSNVFIGKQAGFSTWMGYDNVYIGYRTGAAGHGQYNVYIGHEAGEANDGGSLNTYIGKSAGKSQVTGDYNVYVGQAAATNKLSGRNNTFVGYYTGANNLNGSNNVFIGTNAGWNETGSNTLHISNSTNPLIFGFFKTGGDTLRSVVIDGKENYGYKFYVTGRAGGHYEWNSLSDKNIKKNIRSIGNALSKALQLNGVYYQWIDAESFDDKQHLGFIAQDVEKVIPEVVNNYKGVYSMQYAPITALLVEAIKEQQQIIDEQQKEIETLKARSQEIDKLREEIQAIMKIIGK